MLVMVSQQSQQMIEQAQVFQQELQLLLSQKGTLTLELNDIKRALDELDKTDEKEAYKISGSILIKSDIEKIKKELADRKELADVRIQTIEKREKKIKERIEEIKEKISL